MKFIQIIILLASTSALMAQGWVEEPINDSTLAYKEYVQLDTNGDLFITGESIYFNVYCRDAHTHQPSELSTIVYVEMIAKDLTSTMRSKLSLDNGQGHGSYFIPSSVPTGNYTLIAYTKWMKNFEATSFLRKELTIVNPYNNGFATAGYGDTNSLFKLVPEDVLIHGIDSRVLVKTQTNLSFTGKLIDQDGQTLTTFKSQFDGNSSFGITPKFGSEYTTIINSSEGEQIMRLPVVKKMGSIIRVSENENRYEVKVINAGYEGVREFKILVIDPNGILRRKFSVYTSEAIASSYLDKSNLPQGDFLLACVDPHSHEMLAGKIVHNDNETSPLEVETNRENFNTREKVTVVITNNDSLAVDFSLSAHIRTDKRLTNNHSPSPVAIYDAYKSWTELDKVAYLPDKFGSLISGRIMNGSAPLANKMVYATLLGSDQTLLISKTDAQGRYYFNTRVQTSVSDLILSTEVSDSIPLRIIPNEDFLEDHSFFEPSDLTLDSAFANTIKKRNVYSQIENAYYKESRNKPEGNEEPLFFGAPEKVYHLDDFTRFPTIEDVLREYVAEVIVRKEKGYFELRILNKNNGFPFELTPLILLDGIPVSTQEIMKYDPLLIKDIALVREFYFYSQLRANGIMSFTSYTGKADGLTIEANRKLPYVGPQLAVFESEKDTRAKRTPDFRVQLYWNSKVRIEANSKASFEFFTSDIESDFVIQVNGINDLGISRQGSAEIHVRKSSP